MSQSEHSDELQPAKKKRDRSGFWVHIRLSPAQMLELDALVAHLEQDPDAARFGKSVSRASGLRYALGVAARQLTVTEEP